MRAQSSAALALWLLASSYAPCVGADPVFNANDTRFYNWRPPGPDDSRCACPALNSLANHGFLPHDGRNVSASDLVVAAFQGFGVSPETSAFIAVDGVIDSDHAPDFRFKLEHIQRPDWRIEHDCSLSRHDRYTAHAAAHGAAEIGMLLGVFVPENNEDDRLFYIRSLFENETIPVRDGWVPRRFCADVDTVLRLGVNSLTADPELLSNNLDGVRIVTRDDIIGQIRTHKVNFAEAIKQVVRLAGFTDPRRPKVPTN
ncbi:hypothetical protein HIM_01044 [Hirsutella minnesotensis 3608]|nr:hypothetical protein HIM_01044 [Hirsutella minnesotensis 3608]